MNLPSIILIVLDTARAKSFSCYDYKRNTTPNIDIMGKKNVLFENAYAPASWTLPSHASMFTGLFPIEIPSQIGDLSSCEEILTLPRILKRIGYYTAGISSNYLISDTFGFRRGFDRFFKVWQLFNSPHDIFYIKRRIRKDLFSAVKHVIKGLSKDNPLVELANLLYRKYYSDVIHNSIRATEKATIILQKQLYSIKNSQVPGFLFINYMCTHNDYNPPAYDRRLFINEGEKRKASQDAIGYYMGENHLDVEDFIYLTKLYDAELHYVDRNVGQIFDALEESKLSDNTMVIVTSDHGEHIGEHNHINHLFSVYQEIIHVPLIIKYPGDSLNARREEKYISLKDLVYLIDEVLNGKLAKYLQGEPLRNRQYIISSMNCQTAHLNISSDAGNKHEKLDRSLLLDKFAVISDGYKLIKSTNNEIEFYNIKKDPTEENNLAKCANMALQKQSLAVTLDNWLNKYSGRKRAWEKEISREVIRNLEALGYM